MRCLFFSYNRKASDTLACASNAQIVQKNASCVALGVGVRFQRKLYLYKGNKGKGYIKKCSSLIYKWIITWYF